MHDDLRDDDPARILSNASTHPAVPPVTRVQVCELHLQNPASGGEISQNREHPLSIAELNLEQWLPVCGKTTGISCEVWPPVPCPGYGVAGLNAVKGTQRGDAGAHSNLLRMLDDDDRNPFK